MMENQAGLHLHRSRFAAIATGLALLHSGHVCAAMIPSHTEATPATSISGLADTSSDLPAPLDFLPGFDFSQGTQQPVMGGASRPVVYAWTQTTHAGQYGGDRDSLLSSPDLATSTYMLEVHGAVVGISDGGYARTLDCAPVPLPGALSSLLTGLVLLGLVSCMHRFGRKSQPASQLII